MAPIPPEQRNRRMVISVTAQVAARRSAVTNRTTAMTYNELVDLARLCAYNSRITTDRESRRYSLADGKRISG